MLLDKLGHARSLGIEGNHNALHGFEGIADLAKNSWEIPWTRLNPMDTGWKEFRGWIPLQITKKRLGELHIAKESP
jgi:hypothetical protein